MSSEQYLDSVVTAVIHSFKQRAEIGQKKYGTNLDRTDLSVLDWIQHAQEEHMDAILYLEKLKQCFQNQTLPQQLSKVQSSFPLPSEGVKIPHHQEESKKTVDSASAQMEEEKKEEEEDNHLTHWGC